MLLTVYESSYILGIKSSQLYYELRMCRVDSAIKVLSNWRLDESGLKELYDRINAEGIGITSGDSGLQGYYDRLENIRKKCMENPSRSPFTRVQRRRRMERPAVGSDCMDSGKRRKVIQLEFWPNGDYF